MRRTVVRALRVFALGISAAHLVGCGPPAVSSEEQAEAAYLGLDNGIERAINLGFDGFNAASSANIPEQRADGDVSGEMIIDGQVDQGASANKGMRLQMALVGYSDDPVELESGEEIEVTYDTGDTAPLALTIQLRNIPNGTFSGTLVGALVMEGDLEGELEVNLALAGEIEPDPNDESRVRRVPGSTSVTGTATSAYGTYDVDLTR